MGVREEGRGERGAPGCCVGGKQKLGSALVKEPERCEIQGTAGPSAKQHQPWQEPWGCPASGAGVWPCLDARLGSSRLSQCQEAVALREGRQDLAELLLWSSGSRAMALGQGQAGAAAPWVPPLSTPRAASWPESPCFCHSALGAWKRGNNH